MPRAERLSTRLDSLLDAIFEGVPDAVSLYGDIAAHLHGDQLAQAQKKIRKILQRKGEIRAESAVLIACVLHLTGFPAHRILHFLSLYIPGGIRLSLFELAVRAIFPGEPPIPASLLYDLTQYTYLEKRLLARRSIEISEQLRGSLTPGVLLYLYLLSLRDDLSNEHIQLISLILKNCFPELEVRPRLGGASLEEYAEIARDWKFAAKRSLNLDIGIRAGAEGRGGRAFNRDSASYFLDKYFSDDSLAEMRASAPLPAVRSPVRSRVPARRIRTEPTEGALKADRTQSRKRTPKARAGAAARSQPRSARSSGKEPPAAEVRPRRRNVPSPGKPRGLPALTKDLKAPVQGAGKASGRLLLAVPVFLAAVVVAILLVSVPMGFRRGAGMPSPSVASAEPAGAPAGPAGAPAGREAAPAGPAGPLQATTTYVVKPGDSLWKIFTSVRSEKPDGRGWIDFLSNAQSMNSLNDPDLLKPGKVLMISVQK